jgi:hypothetical protein
MRVIGEKLLGSVQRAAVTQTAASHLITLEKERREEGTRGFALAEKRQQKGRNGQEEEAR